VKVSENRCVKMTAKSEEEGKSLEDVRGREAGFGICPGLEGSMIHMALRA
jgi:hypothetical protein